MKGSSLDTNAKILYMNYDCFIPRSHSYCLSLPLCLEWYNGSITPQGIQQA